MSIKDYFLSEHIKVRTTAFFAINEAIAHSIIAQTCLAYLLYLGKFFLVDESTIHTFPLALYAAEHWITHMKLGSDSACTTAKLITHLFSIESMAFTNWVRLRDPDNSWQQDLKKPAEDIPSPLYYASILGLQDEALQLLKNGANVHAQGGKYSTALQAASYGGHYLTVRLLIENGADVNAKGGKYGSALQAASYAKHDTVINILLEKGAMLNPSRKPVEIAEDRDLKSERLQTHISGDPLPIKDLTQSITLVPDLTACDRRLCVHQGELHEGSASTLVCIHSCQSTK